MELKKTKDYSIFGEVNSNREVNAGHLKKLVRAIQEKDLLHLNPIIVDEYKRVIDGQHRLEAAKELGLPIYYILAEDVNKEDIAALNSNKKNWSVIDYVNYHTVEGKPGFNTLSKFISVHPIGVSSALMLLSSTGKRDLPSLREGWIDVNNVDQAEEIADFLKWLLKYYEHAYQRGVVSAIRKMWNMERFDPEYLKEKIEGQPRSLVKCVRESQYLDMFLDIYNYKLSINRLSN